MRHSASYPWVAVGLLSVANVFALVDRFVINLLVEPIKAALALSDVQMGLITGPAFAIMFGLLGLPIGWWADVGNRRNLISFAVAFWGVCTALCGLANRFGSLFLARVGVGAGEAALLPSAYSMLGDMFPKEKLGRALGVFTLGSSIGGGIAFVLGGALFAAFSARGPYVTSFGVIAPWQATLIAVGLPGVLLALILRFVIDEPQRRSYGVQDQRPSFGSALRHVQQERHFYLPTYLCYSLISACAYGIFAWHATFVVRAYGMSPSEVGLLLGPIGLATGVVAPIGFGWLSDWIHARGGAVSVMRAAGGLFVLIALAAPFSFSDRSVVVMLVATSAQTACMVGIFCMVPVAIQSVAHPRLRGQLGAIQLLCSNVLGLSVGPVAISLLSTYAFLEGGLGSALIAFTIVVCVSGSVVSFLARAPSAGAMSTASQSAHDPQQVIETAAKTL